MPSQSLLQLRAVILHPAPNRCVIDIETAFLQQLLNIAQRQRIAKIPPDRTKYEAGFGLTPFEDRGSGYHFAILSRHQPAALKVATHPVSLGTLLDQAAFRVFATSSSAIRCSTKSLSLTKAGSSGDRSADCSTRASVE